MLCISERKRQPSRSSRSKRWGPSRQETRRRVPQAGPIADPVVPKKTAVGALVLVVEDFDDAREILTSLLQFYGFRVVEAVKGNEAVEKAMHLLPDIVLMDLALPGMDGWQATRELKAHPRTRKIPVIAVTAHALPEDERKALDAGCDSFLTKPVHPTELLGEMRRLLERIGPKRPGA